MLLVTSMDPLPSLSMSTLVPLSMAITDTLVCSNIRLELVFSPTGMMYSVPVSLMVSNSTAPARTGPGSIAHWARVTAIALLEANLSRPSKKTLFEFRGRATSFFNAMMSPDDNTSLENPGGIPFAGLLSPQI